jgi:hypothetical protein
LWRRVTQITRTTPLRRMILHFGQIFFTELRTFIVMPPVGAPVADPRRSFLYL